MNTEENDIEAENDLRDSRLPLIFERYGEEHQRWKLIEECGELLAELGRFKCGDRTNVADLIHEAADVLVVARQFWTVERHVFEELTIDDAVENLTYWTAELAQAMSEETYRLFGPRRLAKIEHYAFALAELLEEELMIHRAIDMKIERQLERIAREAQESGK